MEKFTKEYVEGLSEHLYLTDRLESYETRAYIQGYMKALEEVGATDMLEALIEVNKLISIDSISNDLYNKVINAINKATK